MKRDWAKELKDLGIECCGFWKLDEEGKRKVVEYWTWLKKKDEKNDRRQDLQNHNPPF